MIFYEFIFVFWQAFTTKIQEAERTDTTWEWSERQNGKSHWLYQVKPYFISLLTFK